MAKVLQLGGAASQKNNKNQQLAIYNNVSPWLLSPPGCSKSGFDFNFGGASTSAKEAVVNRTFG